MRIVAIADTHMPRGARRLPEACVEAIRSADLVLHAGDLVSAGFLEELGGLGPPVKAVHGNMDEPVLRERLPAELVVEADGARIGMVHIGGPAAGRHERLTRLFPDCDAVVYGHSHLPELARARAVWILNPGSPTERRRAPSRSWLEILISAGAIEPRLHTDP
jgi:putative phosphoesterase